MEECLFCIKPSIDVILNITMYLSLQEDKHVTVIF